MSYSRMFFQALLSASALIALIGVSPASADSFCRDKANPCLEGYAVGLPFIATTKSSVLKGTGFEVVCASTLEGESTAYLEEGKGVTNKVKSLTFSGCVGTCETASAASLPYSMLALATESGNGTAKLTAAESGSPGMTLTGCTATKQTCTYSTSEETLQFTGGKGGSEVEDPKLVAKEVPLARTAGPCPATSTWSATYVVKKVGIQENASWWWWSSDPIISWGDYDFGKVKAGTTKNGAIVIKTGIEVTYGQTGLTGNNEKAFALGVDNCSNQTIEGECTIEFSCTPPKAGPVYEATMETPWEEVGGSERTGTVKVRLKCTGE